MSVLQNSKHVSNKKKIYNYIKKSNYNFFNLESELKREVKVRKGNMTINP